MMSKNTPEHGAHPAAVDPNLQLIAAAIGNTRARIGVFKGRSLEHAVTLDADDGRPIADALAELAGKPGAADASAVLVSSVAEPRAGAIEPALRKAWPGAELFRIGREIPIPMKHAMRDASTVGHDRLLCALAAYRRAQQACVVVDAGTAVTVDFVDGEGTFHGGAIAPGLTMMLRALHRQTAQLPDIGYEPPAADRPNPFGQDTPDAMRLGVAAAVRGLVRDLVERYAEFYGAFPQIVATGGDMAVLEGDGLIEHFVPDLQLLGMQAVAEAAAAGDDEAGPG